MKTENNRVIHNTKINPATAQDESAIKALLRRCELPSDDLSTSHLAHFLVIKDDRQVIGSVGIEVCDEYGLLRSLAVIESFRGHGLGIRLVDQIEKYALSQQIELLYLLTTTADRFFTANGYKVIPRESAPAAIKETTEFKSICPASAVCMKKKLV
jgi:amino-acid N-acetyltransferase